MNIPWFFLVYTLDRQDDIPDGLFKQMLSVQTATNEFLRQYWHSVYPSATEPQSSSTTPAQRAAKASKMIGYVSQTAEKVSILKKTAEQNGIDTKHIETVTAGVISPLLILTRPQAMKPTLAAAETALTFNRTRKVPRA